MGACWEEVVFELLDEGGVVDGVAGGGLVVAVVVVVVSDGGVLVAVLGGRPFLGGCDGPRVLDAGIVNLPVTLLGCPVLIRLGVGGV